jgi:transglutaminase-like putative cysteine protease
MDRRTLLAASLAASFAGGEAFAQPLAQTPAQPAGAPWRRYRVTTRVELSATDQPAGLWLPLAQSVGGYQQVLDTRFETDGRAETVKDARYGASMLRVQWDQAGPRTASVVQLVAVRDRGVDPAALSAEEQRFWLQPTESLPTGGIVKATADKIVAGRAGPREKLRAIYDWVVDNTFRDASVPGCGTGGIENMLETGLLGGKCADINSLMTGLCRAAGIPARDAYGVRLGPSAYVKQLGASGDVSHAQHCRTEAWIAGEGWVPLDPADVRKVVLEAKLPVDSAEVKAQRARLFGSWEMNWMVYNHATDVALPGAPRPMDETFLMYPCAMTAKDELNQLKPETFRYRITSELITA